MNWYKVAEFPVEADLSDVHRFFQHRGLPHRFTESGDRQQLWIADEHLLPEAREFVERWQRGEIQLPETDAPAEPASVASSGPGIGHYPLTMVIIGLGVIGYFIVTLFTQSGLLPALTFQNFEPTARGLVFEPVQQAWQRGELWRLVTPAFLHFNILHIVFNALWIWEFGRRLEIYFSKVAYLTLFFVIAIGANIVQYLTVSDVPFGGLSGVVYGYMGVLFVARRIAPHPVLAVPPGIFGFMLVWLALGVFGVIDLFLPGPAAVGNGAHLGGLLFGLVLGYIFLNHRR